MSESRGKAFFDQPVLESKSMGNTLLKHVMDANPGLVRKTLNECKENKEHLILQSVRGVEHCGREWETSPLYFAAWAGDNEMIDMLLERVPSDSYVNAIGQLKAVLERKESDKHGGYLAPYYVLIDAYKKFDEQDRIYRLCYTSPINSVKAKEYWVRGIGGAQGKLPIVGLQLYCGLAGGQFDNPSCSHILGRELNDFYGDPIDLTKLGEDYALYKMAGRSCRTFAIPAGQSCGDDRIYLKKFCDVKKQHLEETINRLGKVVKQQLDELLPKEVVIPVAMPVEKPAEKSSLSCSIM